MRITLRASTFEVFAKASPNKNKNKAIEITIGFFILVSITPHVRQFYWWTFSIFAAALDFFKTSSSEP